MTLSFVLALCVHRGEIDPSSPVSSSLLLKANAWLSRRLAGHADELLICGRGFADVAQLAAELVPYGLSGANLMVTDEAPEEQDDAAVGDKVRGWCREHHRAAIPVVSWKAMIPEAPYPTTGWWWVGIESASSEAAALADTLRELSPDSFAHQAQTWVDVVLADRGATMDDRGADEYEEAMSVVALARWLTGFSAAAGDTFYCFSCSDAVEAAGIDLLRLGFEAGLSHHDQLQDAFHGLDSPEEGLPAAALQVCLEGRTDALRDMLDKRFAGAPALFWSLHSCIWPNFEKPAVEDMDDLVNPRRLDMGDLEVAWLFVTDGWAEVE